MTSSLGLNRAIWVPVTHYLSGAFGKTLKGRMAASTLPPGINRVIVLAPYPEQRTLSRLGPPESVVCVKTWSEVLEKLKEAHQDNTKVAVIPDEPLQMFPD